MASPALLNHVYIEIDGQPQDELVGDLVALTVESSLHLPDSATLVLHDSRLHWIDQQTLEPGKSLKIKANTDGKEHPLFDGEIVGLEPAFVQDAVRLVVRAYDRLHRLSRGRKVRSFVNVTDGDVAKKLAGEAGLSFKGKAGPVHKYLFQNNETNLEFLRARAAALGFVVYVDGKTLHFTEPKSDSAAVELQWAATLTEFHPCLTTVDQVTGTMVRGWDPEKKQEIVGRAQTTEGGPDVGVGKPGGSLAEQAFGGNASDLGAHVPVRDQETADKMAKALAGKHASRFIEADAVCAGNPQILAGSPVKMTSLGTRFSGTYLVTSCRHEYGEDKDFKTHFSVSGQNPSTLLSLLAPQAPPVTNRGLVVGIITDNKDPDGLGRVKVKYPWLAPDQASDWARVLSVGGGSDRGISFLPEVNDEVLVGFEQGDIHYPYILGGLWNGNDKPADDAKNAVSGGKVQKRGIRTRVGHQIMFDDTDGGGGIEIVDKNKNSIKIDTGSDTLKIKVKGDVTIDADGACKVTAKGAVQITATQAVEIKGMGAKLNGGGGMVEIKGSMVNLN